MYLSRCWIRARCVAVVSCNVFVGLYVYMLWLLLCMLCLIEVVSHTHTQVRLSKMVLRVGVVIEGRSDGELPEQMLLSTLLNRIDSKIECYLDH